MKKIMFENKRFGLEDDVLAGRKTMTRRVIKVSMDDLNTINSGLRDDANINANKTAIIKKYASYQVGEVVAVAQSYEAAGYKPDMLQQKWVAQPTVFADLDPMPMQGWVDLPMKYHKGWVNKMYVLAECMPHQIRITNIKMERIQDISDEDCRKEGIIPITWRQWHKQEWDDLSPQQYTDHGVFSLTKFRDGILDTWGESEPDEYMAETAQTAFAVLIFKLMGRKVWEQNPWVFAYEFELVK